MKISTMRTKGGMQRLAWMSMSSGTCLLFFSFFSSLSLGDLKLRGTIYSCTVCLCMEE